MSEIKEVNAGKTGPSHKPMRLYILIAGVLLVVIVVAGILLITKGLPALRKNEEPTAVTGIEPTATFAPTFTPGPTKAPTNTPLPPASPTAPAFVMTDDYTVTFRYLSAGARPSSEWTGFFGQVLDAEGNPLPGVPLIILYPDGRPVELEGIPTSPIVKTDADGSYEIRLADAPLAGSWSILVLTDDGHPASDFLTFQTDENTGTGIQQIQVLWQQVP